MNKSKLAALTLIVSLALGACATRDGGLTSAESIVAEVSALNAPSGWVFGGQSDEKIADDWSVVFNDLNLITFIDVALNNNRSLRASAESVARSEAVLKQARSGLLPNVGANFSAGGGGALEGTAFSDRYSGGLSASWEADIWGGIRAGVLASGYDVVGTKAIFESARQALIAAVARSYILSIEAGLQTALSQKTLAAQRETLRIVNVRYELGAASLRERVLAESDVAMAHDNLVLAQSAKTDAVMSLQLLLGQYPDGALAIPAEFPKLVEAFAAGTPDEMLRRRPDVVAAEFSVLSAFEMTRAARVDKWPNLSLSAGLDAAAGSLANIVDPVSIAYSLGLRLADTLFDGGLSQGRIDGASANQRQALSNYGQTVLNAYFDAEMMLKAIATFKARSAFVVQAANAARQTLRLAEIQYKEGAIDLLDVLTFRQRSFQADRTEIILQRQSIDARIALYLALGGAGFDVVAK